MSFAYGPTRQRQQVSINNGNSKAEIKRYYLPGSEYTDVTEYIPQAGTSTVRHIKEYIYSPYGLVAIRNENRYIGDVQPIGNPPAEVHAVATDHLGSIVAEYSFCKGYYEFFGYDAWGRRYRQEFDSRGRPLPPFYFDQKLPCFEDVDNLLEYFTRGYTGHEHLDMFGLINMNGRMYDPIIARFLSPDPFVQAPTFTQSYNRYSYVFNNPLKYTDPSGYITKTDHDMFHEESIYLNRMGDWLFMLGIGGGGGGGGFGRFGMGTTGVGNPFLGMNLGPTGSMILGGYMGSGNHGLSSGHWGVEASMQGNVYSTSDAFDVSDFFGTLGTADCLFSFYLSSGIILSTVNVTGYPTLHPGRTLWVPNGRDIVNAWREINFYRNLASIAHNVNNFINNNRNLAGAVFDATYVFGKLANAPRITRIAGPLGYVVSIPQAARDVRLMFNGELKGVELTDAIFNIISMMGWPGAAIYLGYLGSKEFAKGIQELERQLQLYIRPEFFVNPY
ncbi:MAG: RHS repeat-associated core domain-containing protein [Bacteroidales bacterium]|nr:RHS repeat-associated core domain-containing protein [Bacteroidales bacterium]